MQALHAVSLHYHGVSESLEHWEVSVWCPVVGRTMSVHMTDSRRQVCALGCNYKWHTLAPTACAWPAKCTCVLLTLIRFDVPVPPGPECGTLNGVDFNSNISDSIYTMAFKFGMPVDLHMAYNMFMLILVTWCKVTQCVGKGKKISVELSQQLSKQ